MALLEVRNIEKHFGTTQVLNDISFDLEEGKALAIIARRNNVTMEQLKEHYDADFEAAVIRSVLAGKAMCFIRDNATITVTEK